MIGHARPLRARHHLGDPVWAQADILRRATNEQREGQKQRDGHGGKPNPARSPSSAVDDDPSQRADDHRRQPAARGRDAHGETTSGNEPLGDQRRHDQSPRANTAETADDTEQQQKFELAVHSVERGRRTAVEQCPCDQ